MTNQYFLDRIAGRNLNLRAADADREQTAERLRTSHAEGRLDLAEFQERVERCYKAKTVGELEALVSDLPRQDERNQTRAWSSLGSPRFALAPLAGILIALIVISAAIGHQVFWVWLPLLFLFSRMLLWRQRRSWAGPRH